MKVLKSGRSQAGWSKSCVCTGYGNGGGGCGAKLLVSEHDLYRTYRHYIDGSSDHFTTFCCIQCGVETDIDDDAARVRGVQPSAAKRKERALQNAKRES